MSSHSALTFTISTQYDTVTNDDITSALISDIVHGFESDDDNFIVLTPNRLIQDSLYMQAATLPDNHNMRVIEVRLTPTPDTFIHYSYETESYDQIAQWLIDYWANQQLPDLSLWKDITNEF